MGRRHLELKRAGVLLLSLAALIGASSWQIVRSAQAAGIAKYVFSPRPIAGESGLAAGQSVPVTVTAEDSTGVGLPSTTIYLSFIPAPGGGTATAGPSSTVLTPTPTAFVADSSGTVAITYTAPANYLASTAYAKETDAINAQNAPTHASVHQTDTYIYHPLNDFHFVPNLIAAPGKLAKGAQIPITITAQAYPDIPLANELTYLSKQSTAQLGTASVNSVALTKTPRAFRTDSNGQIVVTYTASNAIPTPVTGTDTVVAQSSAKAPAVTGTDSYSYGKPAAYKFIPKPIAPTHSLAGGASVTFTLTVTDAHGGIVAGAKIYLLFSQAPGGGSASCIGNTPRPPVVTNSKGQLVCTYQTPFTLPTSGTDTITAENSSTKPTLTASDSYTF